ncbi:GGDEF domain-containing protein [Massilia sp. DJPM01]|uniref:GGDEF domain-containing protein n=1 Tax=Massilia sp. DJPM01 TaxID=3024404 RepID=UPI00259DF22D|nr:GGDEF domain-containing protein [Massilia sp. DJPM01]MDM5182230.1 GGDEF domain-containing protein [Massilia sp. DJPM01]
MIVFTATLLVWQHFGMERVMEFSAASGRPVELVDDRLQQGGSVARLTRRPDALTMNCDLRLTFQWPYCRFLFTLSKNEVGVDLSEFDAISFDMSYEGPGDHTARLVLRNFEPGMSTLTDDMSQKVNEANFIVPAKAIVVIPVKVLRTAPWWTDMRHVPLLQTDMRIDNVTTVDLSIGARDTEGHHREVNDTHGHGVGDQVLCAFAAAIQRGIQASGKLARWRGAEFLIICSGTKGADAHFLAEKLREALPYQIWPHGLRVTASFGVTALQPGEVIGDAIKRADSALCQAKSHGKNCVRAA